MNKVVGTCTKVPSLSFHRSRLLELWWFALDCKKEQKRRKRGFVVDSQSFVTNRADLFPQGIHSLSLRVCKHTGSVNSVFCFSEFVAVQPVSVREVRDGEKTTTENEGFVLCSVRTNRFARLYSGVESAPLHEERDV